MTQQIENKEKKQSDDISQVNIGEALLRQRKTLRLSIENAAKAINLSKDVIKKLEDNDFHNIGAPVYVRGYLTLYAKYLGLNSSDVVQMYNTQYPNKDSSLRPAFCDINTEVKQKYKRHSKTISFLVSSVLFAGLLYAYYYYEPVLLKSNTQQENVVKPSEEDKTLVKASQENLDNDVEDVQELAEGVLNGQSVGKNTSLVSDLELDLNNITLESNPGELSDVKEASTPSDTSSTLSKEDEKKVEEALKANESMTDNENGNASLNGESNLKITFTTDCWLEILDANGKKIKVGVFNANKPLDITAKLPITMRTARGSVVKTVLLNKKEVSLEDYRIDSKHFKFK